MPPWEDSPEQAAQAAIAKASASAEPPRQAAPPPAPTDEPAAEAAPPDDGPPSWVDEAIPDDAEGGLPGLYARPGRRFRDLATEAAPAPTVRAMAEPRAPRQPRARLADMSAQNWPELAARLPVTGLAAELARQSEWAGVQGDAVVLRVAVRTLAESESRVRLQTVLCEHSARACAWRSKWA